TIQANTAPDGSKTGSWQWIDPQGSNCFDPNNTNTWARWDTPDLADGTHVVRVYAYSGTIAEGNFQEMTKETTYTLSRRKPSRMIIHTPPASPEGRPIDQPGANQWFTTRTITFTFEPAIDQRINYITFEASTNSDPRVNPIVTRTFDPSVRSFSYTF